MQQVGQRMVVWTHARRHAWFLTHFDHCRQDFFFLVYLFIFTTHILQAFLYLFGNSLRKHKITCSEVQGYRLAHSFEPGAGVMCSYCQMCGTVGRQTAFVGKKNRSSFFSATFQAVVWGYWLCLVISGLLICIPSGFFYQLGWTLYCYSVHVSLIMWIDNFPAASILSKKYTFSLTSSK